MMAYSKIEKPKRGYGHLEQNKNKNNFLFPCTMSCGPSFAMSNYEFIWSKNRCLLSELFLVYYFSLI